MNDSIKKFLIIGLCVAIGLFILFYTITKPTGTYDIINCVSKAISLTVVLMGFYERFLWKFNFLDKTPQINGFYSGTIEYEYNNKPEMKKASIEINQSLLSVRVKIITNEITSSTIVGNLIIENEENILYYTYITNPKSKYSQDNPVQYGTCRLLTKNKNELQGTYWTSRQTKGDINLKRSIK
jgi:hypothetical protein